MAAGTLFEKLTKRHLIICACVCVLAIIIGIIIGAVAPQRVLVDLECSFCPSDTNRHDSVCAGGVDMGLGRTFVSPFLELDTLNRGLAVKAFPYLRRLGSGYVKPEDGEEMVKTDVILQSMETTDQGVRNLYEQQLDLEYDCQQDTGECSPLLLISLGQLDTAQYRYQVAFPEFCDSVRSDVFHPWIGDVCFEVSVVNSQYSIFIITTILVFFALNIAVSALLVWRLASVHQHPREWTFDQKCTVAVMASLVVYDSPLLALEWAVRGIALNVIGTLCITSFFLVFLTTWLLMVDNVREEPINLRFFVPKVAIVSLFGLFFFGVTLFRRIVVDSDPIGGFSTFMEEIIVLQLFTLLSLFLVLAYAAYLFSKVVAVVRVKRRLAKRFLFLAIPSIAVIVIASIACIFGSGAANEGDEGGAYGSAIGFIMSQILFSMYGWLLVLAHWPMKYSSIDDEDDDNFPITGTRE